MVNPAGAAGADAAASAAVAEGAVAAPPNFTIDAFDKKELKWSRWVERLETALSIYGVANEEMRRNLLLHHMGPESYDVIGDKLAPASPRTKTFQEIVQLMEAYYNPQPLEISENYRFNCRRQGDKDAVSADETVDEYLVALRRIAITCNFGEYLEKALRNHFFECITSPCIKSPCFFDKFVDPEKKNKSERTKTTSQTL